MKNGHKVYLGLGSNLGDRLATLRQVRQTLHQTDDIQVTATSSIYQTSPVGGPSDQPDYLNGVLEISTTLEPLALMNICQSIEANFGRQREVHWGARTLDIDLLFYSDCVIDSKELQLPHPRLEERGFVLQPLCDLAAEMIHPQHGQTLTSLLAKISPLQGVHRLNELW